MITKSPEGKRLNFTELCQYAGITAPIMKKIQMLLHLGAGEKIGERTYYSSIQAKIYQRVRLLRKIGFEYEEIIKFNELEGKFIKVINSEWDLIQKYIVDDKVLLNKKNKVQKELILNPEQYYPIYVLHIEQLKNISLVRDYNCWINSIENTSNKLINEISDFMNIFEKVHP